MRSRRFNRQKNRRSPLGQTAFIWLRGILVDEHNLSAKDTDWYVSALHHWHENGAEQKITPRDGSIICHLEGEGSDEYEMSCRALVDGKIDVLMTTEIASTIDLRVIRA
jgi:hypothetical protein